MSLVQEVGDWFADPAHWSGPDGVPVRVAEHLEISALAVGLALLLGLPLGLLLGHIGRGGALATNISYAGRAFPVYALLVIFALAPPPLGRNLLSTVVTLALFALPPVLTNAYIGVREVDRDTVDAARGMGMSPWQVLRRVELPLAAPLVLGGVRLAATQVIATATIAALVAGGGLGRIITRGFANQDTPQLIAGSLLVAALALLVEAAFVLLQRAVRPTVDAPARAHIPVTISAE